MRTLRVWLALFRGSLRTYGVLGCGFVRKAFEEHVNHRIFGVYTSAANHLPPEVVFESQGWLVFYLLETHHLVLRSRDGLVLCLSSQKVVDDLSIRRKSVKCTAY